MNEQIEAKIKEFRKRWYFEGGFQNTPIYEDIEQFLRSSLEQIAKEARKDVLKKVDLSEATIMEMLTEARQEVREQTAEEIITFVNKDRLTGFNKRTPYVEVIKDRDRLRRAIVNDIKDKYLPSKKISFEEGKKIVKAIEKKQSRTK